MKYVYLIALGCIAVNGCAQRQHDSTDRKTDLRVGGPCEGCEAALEYGDRHLSWVDTIPDFHMPGPKIEVSGVIYASDGTTPAKDVILYVYHADQTGVYPTRGDETGWGRRHDTSGHGSKPMHRVSIDSTRCVLHPIPVVLLLHISMPPLKNLGNHPIGLTNISLTTIRYYLRKKDQASNNAVAAEFS